jgi:hypothetical protein
MIRSDTKSALITVALAIEMLAFGRFPTLATF